MHRFLRFCNAARHGLTAILNIRIRLKFPSTPKVVAGLAILGLMLISCVVGAALMYFELGPADPLRKAFVGFEAWQDRGNAPQAVGNFTAPFGVTVDRLERTFDGFTLYTTVFGSSADLIDMRGNVVHRWSMPFRRAWPDAKHIRDPLADRMIHWFRCHLCPNGDLLAIYQTDVDTPHGYGLVKLDKDSRLLWSYAGHAHHDLDVADDGRIYTLTHDIVSKKYAGIDWVEPPFLDDYLVILSTDGKELDRISLLEAFRDSPYALTLTMIEKPVDNRSKDTASPGAEPMPNPALVKKLNNPAPASGGPTANPWQRRFSNRRTAMNGKRESGEVLHANSVRVLSRALASRFPLFKEGQILISLRAVDTIAVLDIPTRSIVWSAQGIWRAQHDPEFLDNGNLLLYDNFGSTRGARVLEFDPLTNKYPWSYLDENSAPFIASARGMKQRLPNGNTLIVDPDNGRLLEVTIDKQLVWEYGLKPGSPRDETDPHVVITGARRYAQDQLSFLKGVQGVRP